MSAFSLRALTCGVVFHLSSTATLIGRNSRSCRRCVKNISENNAGADKLISVSASSKRNVGRLDRFTHAAGDLTFDSSRTPEKVGMAFASRESESHRPTGQAPSSLGGDQLPMHYIALACDYDGTLAHDGKVSEPTLAALERLLASGRRLVLVSGRELED